MTVLGNDAMTTARPLADGLLAALLADVREPAGLAALSDYLAEQVPGPVRLAHLPDWLRRAWLRARRGDADRPWPRYTAGWAVTNDMEHWLARPPYSWWCLDHHGSVVVSGLLCFASEPYATHETARLQAAALTGKAGCVGVGLPQGAWHRRTVRVLLLPGPGG
jgi:hypothetical protein